MKFKKVKKYCKKVKENPTLKKARKEFKENIGEIKKVNSKITYKKTKLDKKLSNLKYGLDVSFGYQKPIIKKKNRRR